MTLAIHVRLTAGEGAEGGVREALLALLPLSRTHPGCRVFFPHRDPADPRVFVVYEQWADQAALDGWLADPSFVDVVERLLTPNVASVERTELELLADA